MKLPIEARPTDCWSFFGDGEPDCKESDCHQCPDEWKMELEEDCRCIRKQKKESASGYHYREPERFKNSDKQPHHGTCWQYGRRMPISEAVNPVRTMPTSSTRYNHFRNQYQPADFDDGLSHLNRSCPSRRHSKFLHTEGCNGNRPVRARGANGVILVTTKQGVEGPAASRSVENSVSAPTHL